jgi:hypothetical protein
LASQGFTTFDEKVTGRPVHPDIHAWPTSAYGDLMKAVAIGRDCVVTEIFFYVRSAQQGVTRDLNAVRPDVVIQWECFDPADLEIANYNCTHDPERTAEGIRTNLEQNQLAVARLRDGTYELPTGHRLLKTIRRTDNQ